MQHHFTAPGGPSRLLGFAAALLICASLAACTASGPATSAATAPAENAVPLPSVDTDLDAGTYLFDGFTVPFEVTVPEGWTYVNDTVLRKDVGDTEGAFVWFGRATHVPADACGWPDTMAEIAPSVEAFADALAAQASTVTTAPTQVTVGDYRGVEFDLAVEGVDDLTDCPGDKVCIHGEYSSCTRWYNSSVAQRETYRVLDLDGERAILTVGEFDDQTPTALVQEARAVFDSIRFVPNV